MRLFIAIDFNELKDYFVYLQDLLPRNAKLSLTRTFHITLKFLGEVQPDKAEKAVEILKNVKFGPFSVFLDSIGKPEDRILELQNKIDEALKPLFRKEKDFKAHITLARVKYPEDKKAFVDQVKKIKVENKRIEVKDFRLVKSALSPKGAVYGDLALFNSQ